MSSQETGSCFKIRVLFFTRVCGTIQVVNGQITYNPPAVEGKCIGGTTATVDCDFSYKLFGEPYICKKISGVWAWKPESGHTALCAGVHICFC